MTVHRNGVTAVVFDWAGTLVDFGSLAPMGAFVELFAGHGVSISIAQARLPMGLPKRAHVQALAAQPAVATAWLSAHGRSFSEQDLDQLYAEFLPMSVAAAADHAVPIPGVVEAVASICSEGIRVGSTTGYTRAIMVGVLERARQQGLQCEPVICTDDVPQGRPSPLGMYRCMLELQAGPVNTVVKVDDTVPGLLEGRNAGCWTVGIAVSGNAAGLSLQQWRDLDGAGRDAVRAAAHVVLAEAEPDFIVDSVADLPQLLHQLDAAILCGGAPRPIKVPRASQI